MCFWPELLGALAVNTWFSLCEEKLTSVSPYVGGIALIPVVLPVRVSSQSTEGFLRPPLGNPCPCSPVRLSKIMLMFSPSQSLLKSDNAHSRQARWD